MEEEKKKRFNFWLPPKDYKQYFKPSSDDFYRKNYPVEYTLFCILAVIALMAPCFIYLFYSISIDREGNYWMVLGFIGGFIFGIGLFNFAAILVNQYLGHLVSIISLVAGAALMKISLEFMK